MCYFTNWAWYRPSPGKFFPEDTDPNLCTHVVYGFATLDYTDLVIRVFDSWADIDNGTPEAYSRPNRGYTCYYYYCNTFNNMGFPVRRFLRTSGGAQTAGR